MRAAVQAGHPVRVRLDPGSPQVFSAVLKEKTMLVPRVLPYRPGDFFPREPPDD